MTETLYTLPDGTLTRDAADAADAWAKAFYDAQSALKELWRFTPAFGTLHEKHTKWTQLERLVNPILEIRNELL